MMRLVLDGPDVPEDWTIQAAPRRPITRKQYLAFCAANPDWRIERSAEGEISCMAPAPSRSGNQNMALSGQLWIWARNDGTGIAFDASTGFDLPDGSNRSPDASWVLKSRIGALRPEQRDAFMQLCPDFVAELRSSSDRLPALRAKMQEYIANGTQLGWLIDPIERKVWIYRPGVVVECLDSPQTVVAGPLMPGFVLDLALIWNPEIDNLSTV